jgi:hypothetical protein
MTTIPVQSTLIESNLHQLELLNQLLDQLDASLYATGLPILEGGSIGKHIRHILDFYLCLQSAKDSGTICYDHRQREEILETVPGAALERLSQVGHFLKDIIFDQEIMLQGENIEHSEPTIKTTLYRELAYAREHTIHHCAIIRLALRQVKPEIIIPIEFGIAPSTLRHLATQDKLNLTI